MLSIDCGTQSLRAMIFSLDGEMLAIERVPFSPYHSPKPGWAEQDPDVYWEALKSACRNLKKNNQDCFNKIVGCGVTTMRDSMINVDADGNALRPVMVWLDQRKAQPVYRPHFGMKMLIKIIGMEDSIDKAQRDGKCNWIRQNQPDIWDKTYKYLQVSGFLNFKLTGEFKDSVASQVGHIPFDYKKQKWGTGKEWFTFSAKLYPVEKEKLPNLVAPGESLGIISASASEETGLPEHLPVISCGSDKGCETLGMGVVQNNWASLSFGTTATVQTTTKRYLEPVKYMPSYPAVLPGRFNPEVEIFRGFWMVTWFKEEFACKEIKKAKKKGISVEAVMDRMLKKSEPGSHGLIVQPYWSPGLKEPSAKGAMIGFGDVHKKFHVYRAVIEGLTFALREGLEKIEKVSGNKVKKVAVSGGASQSNQICQITADVFNRPVVRGKTTETSGLGAAILIAVGTGNYANIEEATSKMINHEHEFYPDKEHVKTYHELYHKVYRKMFKKLMPLYHQIRNIMGYPE